MMRLLDPASLWCRSCELYQRGHVRRARLLKSLIYVMYRAVLPYECRVAPDVSFLHRALNVVVHPNTTIASGVVIGHGVTLGIVDERGAIEIGEHTFLGAHSIVIAGAGRRVTIGPDAVIGAGAVVHSDVPPGTTMLAPAAVARTRG